MAQQPPHPGSDYLRLARHAASGIEAVTAGFHGHAYDMHHHEEWLIGVTHRGVQDFHCRGQRRQSTRGGIILIEPGEKHDGQAVEAEGFAYSMLYLPQWLVKSHTDGRDGHIGFRQTLAEDAVLARAVLTACDFTFDEAPLLAVDAATDRVLDLLNRHLGRRPRRVASAGLRMADRAAEYLQDRFDEQFGLDELTLAAGASSRFALTRAFQERFGTAPHAYLVHLRLAKARLMLRDGTAPAEVAAATGFSDQSHLGRWFRRTYGLTPAAYRRGRTNVPDRPGSAS